MRVLALLAVAVVAGGCGGSAAPQDARSLYEANCSACHSGNGPGPNLATMQLSRAAIVRAVDDGKGAMPADLVGRQDARRIADYLTK